MASSPLQAGLALIIMGVSGSGKSTIGHLLAKSLGCAFLDGDDFHSAENKEKMKQGIPLSDSDRLPWLETIRDTLIDYILWGKVVILACSALKPTYRDLLRTADFQRLLETDRHNLASDECSAEGREEAAKHSNSRVDSTHKAPEGSDSQPSEGKGQSRMSSESLPSRHRVQFLLLNGPIKLFASRLEQRFKEGAHFMPPTLLQSQMDSLNIESNEDDVVILDASLSPDVIVRQVEGLVCGAKVQGISGQDHCLA